MDRDDHMERAKRLLLGAVDTVLGLATESNGDVQPTSTSRLARINRPNRDPAPTCSSSLSRSISIEHKRSINPFKPSKSYNRKMSEWKKRTVKAPSKWRRDCICLSEMEQTWKPSPEEKMELAQMGLGLKEVSFDSDGDADHVHELIYITFPVLKNCGGYTLLRLGSGSKSLVVIEGPEGGVTVPYLKDILNQAKLYIRPLQCDISDEDVQLESNVCI
jgi:hypothetical protein